MGTNDPITEHVSDGTKEYFVWQRNILTLSAGALALLVSLQGQFVTMGSVAVWSLQCAWVLLAIAIILSLIGASGLHNLYFRMAEDLIRARMSGSSGFVDAIIPEPQRTCAKLAPWFFAVSMLLVCYFGVWNALKPRTPFPPLGTPEAAGAFSPVAGSDAARHASRPAAPARIIQIVNWQWVPEGQHGGGDYGEFLRLLDQIQLQQMEAIRELHVREVWIEEQSDETIGEFRRKVLELRDMMPKDGENPADQSVANRFREDLLQIGAAGRLLLAGEIDDVLPLEDHAAWRAAQPVNGRVNQAAKEARERAIVKRVPVGGVFVLGPGHNLRKWLPSETQWLPVQVAVMPLR